MMAYFPAKTYRAIFFQCDLCYSIVWRDRSFYVWDVSGLWPTYLFIQLFICIPYHSELANISKCFFELYEPL